MAIETVIVQLRGQIFYDGATHKRHEVLVVAAQVAEHLVECRKARLVDRTVTGNGQAQ